jgi:glycosyltransferase involved in cell wall biosynthesis
LVAYTGNSHAVNRREVGDLYRAVFLLQERGIPVRLVRTGMDYTRLLDRRGERLRRSYCIELGQIPREAIPAVLAGADVLVQPGRPGPFNDYRFPSKLPEYLASGRPVILPRANLGAHLQDRRHCLWLDDGDAADIAAKIELLYADRSLRANLGKAGREFAEQRLQWRNRAAELLSFYRSI